MKVNIPKNLWLSSADADFFHEGFFSGAYGLTLHFSGHALDSIDIMTEILEPLTKVQLPHRKLVRFEGLYDPKDSYIPLAIEAFRSWGFSVQAVIPSELLDLSWKNSLDWFILKTSSTFIPVVSNELWYFPKPTDQEDLPEPRLPNPSGPVFLYLARGYSVTQTAKFVISAKANWNLL